QAVVRERRPEGDVRAGRRDPGRDHEGVLLPPAPGGPRDELVLAALDLDQPALALEPVDDPPDPVPGKAVEGGRVAGDREDGDAAALELGQETRLGRAGVEPPLRYGDISK